jgi:dTMP kinase
MRGKFISLEGPDGAGKTTQGKELAKYLRWAGYDVVETREPGGTPVAERIRDMLLHESLQMKTEILLFAAARVEHVETKIKPAIAAGKIVICDRFADSSFAYQGGGRGYPADVEEIERFALRGFEPDYTLFFDLSLEESLKRICGRGDANAFDAQTRDFKLAVYHAYKKRFMQNQHRMVKMNAMQDINSVTHDVIAWAVSFLIPSLEQSGVVVNQAKG